jgi:hypothetical protein
MAAQLMATNGRWARDEHGRVRRGDASEQIVHRLHDRALPDQLVEAMRPPDLFAQPPDLVSQVAVLDGPVERDDERIDLDRLRDEVVRARPDGGDRRLEAAEPRQHDDRHVGAIGDEALTQLDAVDLPHVEIGHDDVELGVSGGEERVARRRARDTPEIALRQGELERLAERAVVVDDEDAPRHATRSSGRYTVKVVPTPIALSTPIHPPWSRMIPYVTLSPSPVPSPTSFVVKNGSKTRSMCSASMPVPLSFTRTVTYSPSGASTPGGGAACSRATDTATSPPSGIAWIALTSRFVNAC